MSTHNIFFLGPSGIGKSTVVKRISESSDRFKGVSLDTIALQSGIKNGMIDSSVTSAYDLLKSIGSEAFFMVGITALYREIGRRKSTRILLIDVGAAFQNQPLLASLFRFEKTICLYASPEDSFSRYTKNRDDSRTFSDHKEIEFSRTRRKLYDGAGKVFDTSSMSLEMTVSEVEEYLYSSYLKPSA